MLNQDFAQRWIAALRSGEFEQNQGSLRWLSYRESVNGEREDISYCCLGVACELIAREGRGHWTTRTQFCYGDREEPIYLASANIPQTLADDLGISAEEQGRLIEMNDSRGYNFHQIADYLEKLLIEEQEIQQAFGSEAR